MSLNIKNEETCRLAAELARLTGETMTGAMTVALRERLEREQRARGARGPRGGVARHRPSLRGPPPRRPSRRRPRRPALRRARAAQVIVDTSAVLAILFDEPDADRYARAIAEAPRCRMSVAGYLEAAIVLESRAGPRPRTNSTA